MKPYWNSDESFPSAEGDWAGWRPPFGRKIKGESAVKLAVRRWHPFDPILVSAPGSDKLLPPICLPEMASALQKRTLRQYGYLLLLCMGAVSVFYAAGVIYREAFFLKASFSYFLLLLFLAFQYSFVFRRIGRLRNHSRFVSWCYLQPPTPIILLAVMMIATGSVQYFLQSKVGTFIGLIERYGLVFNEAGREPWRFVTGPFLHSGLPHWLGNFSLLLVAAGLSFPLGRRRFVCAMFFIGVFVPAFLLALTPHWVRSDAFLGVSGGVFALYGWLAGVGLENRREFPFGFGGSIAYFTVAMAVISSLLEPHASWFAHVSGLLIGLLAGAMGFGVKRSFLKPEKTTPYYSSVRESGAHSDSDEVFREPGALRRRKNATTGDAKEQGTADN